MTLAVVGPQPNEPQMSLIDIPFSDIYLSPSGDVPFLKERPGGPLMEIPPAVKEEVTNLARSLPARAGDRREFSLAYNGVTFRVARIEAIDGAWYTMRRGPTRVPHIDEIGLPEPLVRELVEVKRHSGMFVVCGRTGEGKSWTAGALLNAWLERHGDVAITIEDPPELPLNGWRGRGRCFQTTVPEREFSQALVAAMRYTPRFILIGEVRSPDAAREALRASVNGHVVVTTLHAGSIEEGFHRLLDLATGGEGDRKQAQQLLAEGLAGMMHQRLHIDGTRHRVGIRFLFAGHGPGDPVRALIREGKIEQLGTTIEAQSARLLRSAGK